MFPFKDSTKLLKALLYQSKLYNRLGLFFEVFWLRHHLEANCTNSPTSPQYSSGAVRKPPLQCNH